MNDKAKPRGQTPEPRATSANSPPAGGPTAGGPTASSPTAEPRCWWSFTRRMLLLLSLATVLIAFRLSWLRGLVRPVRIHGASMAGTLVGDHLALVCEECGFPFRCGEQFLAADQRAWCPNCGYQHNRVSGRNLQRGQRVLIDRWPACHRPRRWDLVALISPVEPGRLEVKRIVGLPGERVVLRDGQVWLDKRPATKSLAEFRRLALVVHDDAYRPRRADLPARWQAVPQQAAGPECAAWQVEPTGYRIVADPERALSQVAPWRWLGYQHWSCLPAAFPPRARTERTPIWDSYGYNQALSRGTLHAVSDLLVSFRVRFEQSVDPRLAVRMGTADGVWRVEWGPGSGTARLFRAGQLVCSRQGPRSRVGRPHTVEVARCDGRFYLAVDGVTWLDCPAEPAELVESGESGNSGESVELAGPEPSRIDANSPASSGRSQSPRTCRVEIGVPGGGAARVERLRVSRDLFYLSPFGSAESWGLERPLGRDEYLLLGDNVPVSRDSRHWKGQAVSRKLFVGKVLRW